MRGKAPESRPKLRDPLSRLQFYRLADASIFILFSLHTLNLYSNFIEDFLLLRIIICIFDTFSDSLLTFFGLLRLCFST